MEYVLASASPRRRELLLKILPKFEIIPSRKEEKADKTLPPEKVACSLAESKCDVVFTENSDKTVIGCDTIVVFEGEILGKPKDKADAVRTLKRLSGKTHSVITGVCVRNAKKKVIGYEKTDVSFFDLSDEFIKLYVDSGSPMDKAGSYGIQDGGLVKGYVGSYSNVVGLPIELCEKLLDGVRIDQ